MESTLVVYGVSGALYHAALIRATPQLHLTHIITQNLQTRSIFQARLRFMLSSRGSWPGKSTWWSSARRMTRTISWPVWS